MSKSAAFSAGLVGVLLGGLLVLVLARESSDVFVTNTLAIVPHEMAAESKRLFQSGDLKGAQRMLRAQAAARSLASSELTTTRKWDLTYPLSAWLADEVTSGMKPADDPGLPMALATIDAQIAGVMERDGDIEAAKELLERAAGRVSADPNKLRQAAQAHWAFDLKTGSAGSLRR